MTEDSGINSSMLASMDSHDSNPGASNAMPGNSGLASGIFGAEKSFTDDFFKGVLAANIISDSGMDGIIPSSKAFESNPMEDALSVVLSPGKVASGNELNNQNPVGKGFSLEHVNPGSQMNTPTSAGLKPSESTRSAG